MMQLNLSQTKRYQSKANTSIYFSLLKKILSVIGNSNIVILFVGFQLAGKVNIPSSKLLDQTLKKTKKKIEPEEKFELSLFNWDIPKTEDGQQAKGKGRAQKNEEKT